MCNMCPIIGAKNGRITKAEISEHILDVFSALDDLIELISFAMFQANTILENQQHIILRTLKFITNI